MAQHGSERKHISATVPGVSPAPREKRGKCSLPPLLLCLVVLGAAALCFWPTDVLTLKGTKGPVFSARATPGQTYRTRYIHSVQLSPVVDVYRILQGRVWQWQEWIRSHNAGLPSLPPPKGRFASSPPWMIVEGTRDSWTAFAYRVGDSAFGRNEFAYARGPWIPLYLAHGGERLEFSVTRTSLLEYFQNIP
jgi:hypothetical protein